MVDKVVHVEQQDSDNKTLSLVYKMTSGVFYSDTNKVAQHAKG